ncbi:MAG: hypothetical protein HFH60_03360 [Lachnospiraceae bacterium]|nr:hypothetical protein [Lachnospiraceae bacterium]
MPVPERKNLNYLDYWRADGVQLWYNINKRFYAMVHVSGTNINVSASVHSRSYSSSVTRAAYLHPDIRLGHCLHPCGFVLKVWSKKSQRTRSW